MVGTRPEPRYAGTPTFLRAPLVGLDALRPGVVAINGAPYDTTHKGAPGTRSGPKAIREASLPVANRLVNAGDQGIVDVDTGARRTWRAGSLVDVDDAGMYPTDVMRTTEAIAGLVYEVVSRGAFSVCLGE